jgi:hypothetical protein
MPLFTLFPNPANNRITIANKFIETGETIVTIFNINGTQLIQDKYRNQQDIEINVSGLRTGIYIVKIQTGSSVDTKKLVVQ